MRGQGSPPRLPPAHRGVQMGARYIRFRGPEEKARWLDAACSVDAARLYASEAWARPEASPWSGIARRAYGQDPDLALLRWLHGLSRDELVYVRDRWTDGRRGECFSDPETLYVSRAGDCDDKARMFVAHVRLARLLEPRRRMEARIVPVFERLPDGTWHFAHVQAEARIDSTAPWILAEFTLLGVPFGAGAESARRDASGAWLVV